MDRAEFYQNPDSDNQVRNSEFASVVKNRTNHSQGWDPKVKLDIPDQTNEKEDLLMLNSRETKPRSNSIKVEESAFSKTSIVYNDEGWTDDENENDDNGNDRWPKSKNVLVITVMGIQTVVKNIIRWLNQISQGRLINVLFLILYTAYFIAAMIYRTDDESSHRLIGCTILGVIIAFRHYVSRFGQWVFRKLNGSDELSALQKRRISIVRFFVRWLFYGLLAAAIVLVLVDEGRKSTENLRSVPGLIVFLLVCLLVSNNPGKINWHTIFWSMGLQFLLAVAVLKWDLGKEAILWVQKRLDEFFANTKAGSILIFGDKYTDHYMIFGALPVLFLSNAMLTILYYIGAIQFLIRFVGRFLCFILDTTPLESTSVAAGIFMEGTVATLSIRPFLGSLSKSELFVVVTSVLSSLGGAYLAILSSFGVSLEYLIPAMVVSAPATFAVCKLMIPETRVKNDEDDKNWEVGSEEQSKYSGFLDAAQTGATAILPLMGTIISVCIAFFSFISWINNTFEWFGERVGIKDLTIEFIFSYLLYPVALAMGVELEDCRRVAMLLGYRIGSINFIAFLKLAEMGRNRAMYDQYMAATNFTGPVTYHRDDISLDMWNQTLTLGFISQRSEAIVTYSLCGFSSFISVAITLGIVITLIPRRKKWLAGIAGKAVVAGNIANCMTGCFASIFY